MGTLANTMKTDTQIREEIEGIRSLTTAQLKDKYREVFGEHSRSNHKQFLFRRIAASRPTPGAAFLNAPAAAPSRSPTTPTSASGPPGTSWAVPSTRPDRRMPA